MKRKFQVGDQVAVYTGYGRKRVNVTKNNGDTLVVDGVNKDGTGFIMTAHINQCRFLKKKKVQPRVIDDRRWYIGSHPETKDDVMYGNREDVLSKEYVVVGVIKEMIRGSRGQ